MNAEQKLKLAAIEARYLGKPMPPPPFHTDAVIAARRAEAARQLYEAQNWDNDAARAAAWSQFADTLTAETARGMSVVKQPRNDPCPCGSGAKFKHCHGR